MSDKSTVSGLISEKAELERQKASKEREIARMPTGVRSSSVSADIAYLEMDIHRLNQSISEIEEVIELRLSENG